LKSVSPRSDRCPVGNSGKNPGQRSSAMRISHRLTLAILTGAFLLASCKTPRSESQVKDEDGPAPAQATNGDDDDNAVPACQVQADDGVDQAPAGDTAMALADAP